MYGQDCHKDFKLDTVYVDVIEDISVYIIDTISYESLIIDSLYTDNITEFVYLSNTVGDTMVVRVIEHVERVTTDTLYLNGNKIRRPKGVYIENGKIKYIKI